MKKNEFNYFVSLLREEVGWQISESDFFLLDAKLDAVIRKNGIPDTKTLIEEMKKSPKIFLWHVIEALAPLNTSFYRNYRVVRAFENVLLPYLVENNLSTKRIKILSLGCSTGQEVYSIAISIKKHIPDYKKWNIELVGLDISSDAILKAQKGYYSEFEIQHGLNARDIIDNFKNMGDYWQANHELLEMVKFLRVNIYTDNSTNDKFDLIFCRNVLNIFSPEAQKMVIEKIRDQQVDNGFLFLGLGERLNGLEDFYNPSDMECIYKAKHTSEINIKQKGFSDNEMPSFERPDNLKIIKKV